MSNNWFQFKQFTVLQDRCAMKVTTDACILGAWTPIASTVTRILDVGSGSGLLALMLAQRSGAEIDGVEIDTAAAQQAMDNVARSPWGARVTIKTGDIRAMKLQPGYDIVVSNPPFFNNSLLGPAESKNIARHTVTLRYEDLLQVAANNLAPGGFISVLLPAEEHKIWAELCEREGWYIYKTLNIIHRPGGVAKRNISLASRTKLPATEQDLHIYDPGNNYSAEFRLMMQDFYLAF